MKTKDFLKRHKTYAADTMVFIYHFEDLKPYAPISEVLFQAWEKKTHHGVTSIISLLEILVKPKRHDDQDAVRDYKDLLLTFPNLKVVTVDAECADVASDLRAHYGIRTPDAIQVATAILAGATALVTNDDQLKQITELEIVLLDELSI